MSSEERFYVCEYNPRTGEHGIVLSNTGRELIPENCFEWLEADEVADAFRREKNGMWYYVGDKDGHPLLCPQAEIDETNERDTKMGFKPPAPATQRAMFRNFLGTAKEVQ